MRSLLVSFLIATGITFAIFSVAFSAESEEELAASVREVLRNHCYQCHNGLGSSSNIPYDFLSRADLVDNSLVEPGDARSSYLYELVANRAMPPLEQRTRNPVTDSEQDVLRRWIEAGAPDFPSKAEDREFLTLETVLRSVRDFLREQDEEDQPFLRFFTLHHVYNNPKTTEADLPLYRAALSKALNSLNWSVQPVLPQAIDKRGQLHETVFVIDLRDFLDADNRSWDQLGHWSVISKSYPYGLVYPDFAKDDRQKYLDQIRKMLGSHRRRGVQQVSIPKVSIPLVRADWFIATATRPPLYHTLLGIPESAKELERQLGVDIPAAFQQPSPKRIARAGFSKSGVSGQNRLLERSRSRIGAYWKSYDFLPNTKLGQLNRFPLGPLNLFPPGKHPFADQAFKHDGGEIVFTLPNGLVGYMLTDGQDQRIDIGPVEVVSDPLKTSGTPAIVNGLSCMTCHRQGIIDFNDEIRKTSAVFGEAEDRVESLFPNKATMQTLVAQDRQRFMEALRATTASFLQVGSNRTKPIEEFSEPIGEVARLYRLVYLDLATIAVELDVEDPAELAREVGGTPIKKLGLSALFNEGSVISRNAWEASDGRSLMQELAFELRMTPVR